MAINEQILIDKAKAETQSRLADEGLKTYENVEIPYAYYKGIQTALIAIGAYVKEEKQDKQDEQDYRDWNGL